MPKGVRVVVVAKDPRNNGPGFRCENATEAVSLLQKAGVHVVFIDGLHRKLALMDNIVSYEGSLNILSQYSSKEFMRRIASEVTVRDLRHFVGAGRY